MSATFPAFGPAWSIGRICKCRWEFRHTGKNICSCWKRHWHHRPEQRRAALRAELQTLAREWNAAGRKV